MASSGTTTMGNAVPLVDTDKEVVLANDEDDSTGVGTIHRQGGRSVDVLATSVSGREDTSLEDVDTGPWLVEEIPTNGTEEGGGAGGVEVKNLGWGWTGAADVEARACVIPSRQ